MKLAFRSSGEDWLGSSASYLDRSYRASDGLSEAFGLFHRLCFYQNCIIIVLEQPLSLTCTFSLLHVNEKGLLGPSVPDGYTKLGLIGEFDFVRKIFSLRDGFLDLIYHRYVGDRGMFLPVPFLTLLVLEAFGNCLARTHDL